MKILVINPNSSKNITGGIEATLTGLNIPSGTFDYFTPDDRAPASIDDTTTSILSAAACFDQIVDQRLMSYEGYLVCCFSDHPLTHVLREHITRQPVVGIFEAAITHALLAGTRFGIMTSGRGWITSLTDGVRSFLGAAGSARFVGVQATGVGVLEFQAADQHSVHDRVANAAKALAEKGADVLILGCAGMTGMEAIAAAGARVGGADKVAVIDGVKAGAQLLPGLISNEYIY